MGRHINKNGELLYPEFEGDHKGQSKKSHNSPEVILEKASTEMRRIDMRSLLLRPKRKSRPSGTIKSTKAKRFQLKAWEFRAKRLGH
jgi:hypothetical protein